MKSVKVLSELASYAVEFRYTLTDEEPPDTEHLLRLAERFLRFVEAQMGMKE